MLKQNNELNSKQQKLFQSALKHKVRNLRAKVQSLLPIHLCVKIQKRGNRLRNQLVKKYQYQQQKNSPTLSLNNGNKTSNQWKYSYVRNKNQINNHQIACQINKMNRSQKCSIYFKTCQYQNEYFIQEDNRDNFEFEPFQAENKNKQISLKGYHFEKLNNQQIQQIQEDKLYYLGNLKHVQAYQIFIKQKNMIKTTIPISSDVYKSVSKSTIAIGTNKYLKKNRKYGTNTSFQSENFNSFPQTNNKIKSQEKNNLKKYLTDSKKLFYEDKNKQNMYSSKGTLNQTRLFRNTTNDRITISNIQQNLVRINQEQQIKRILLSMQLKSKQERVEQNFTNIKNRRREAIQLQNLKQNFKILSAQQKKRKVDNEVGQIVDLTQKLRKKCIKRKTYKSRVITQQKLNNSQDIQ